MTQPHADSAQQMMAAVWQQAFLGQVSQSGNLDVPARSNLQYLGYSGNSDGAFAATGIAAAVAIPVVQGDVISTINVPVGATAGATITHGFAALYSGIATPALLKQSTDIGTTAAITAEVLYPFALTAPVTITQANAPNGFVYASVAFAQAAGTIPTVVGVTLLNSAAAYQWFATGPLFLAATHGSGLSTTAPATIASPSAKAFAPYVVLT